MVKIEDRLIAVGADPREKASRFSHNVTPIKLAVRNQRVAELLIDHGADPNDVFRDVLLTGCNFPFAEELLKRGAISIRDVGWRNSAPCRHSLSRRRSGCSKKEPIRIRHATKISGPLCIRPHLEGTCHRVEARLRIGKKQVGATRAGSAAAWCPLIVPSTNTVFPSASCISMDSSEPVDVSVEDAEKHSLVRRRRNYSWAQLMKRVCAIDVLQLDRCGGVMRIIAAIHPPETTQKILDCLGLPNRAPPLAPAVREPVLPFDDF
jgi:hypothetical protein